MTIPAKAPKTVPLTIEITDTVVPCLLRIRELEQRLVNGTGFRQKDMMELAQLKTMAMPGALALLIDALETYMAARRSVH